MFRRRALMAMLAMVPAFGFAAGTADLGTIDFPNSGSAEAQGAFIRGVLLLHSFEYDDAREAFREAERTDPSFALAYWGEAMTYNHPLWREQDRAGALEALSRLAPTSDRRLAGAPTPREGDYLRAVEILYGEGDKVERDRAYSEAMGAMAAKYPEDLEARVFHALSILGTAQGVRDFAVYMRAAAVAEEVFVRNPRHPGAAHYLIHSYDDPVHAPLGLRAAHVYAQIAPAASHAQHMISHIYVALGDWSDSIEANRKAFDVSAARRDARSLGVDELNYHALHWLEYSYLQMGRFDAARDALDRMGVYAKESGSPRALWHHAAMRAAWIVETGAREAPPEIGDSGTQITGAAAGLFATGYAAVLAGDREKAAAAAAGIVARHDGAAAGHVCSQSSSYQDTSKLDLIAADVLRKNLEALIEMDRGNTAAALALLDAATTEEAAMPLDYGPPIIVKPSHEIYGEVLLKLGRFEEAAARFREALARAPRRSLSLTGLARAAAAMEDETVLAKTCAAIGAIYRDADDDVAVPAACPGAAPVRNASGR